MSDKFTKTYKIQGMTCKSCEIHIPSELGKLDGIDSVKVDFNNKLATIESSKDVSDELVNECLQKVGYSIQNKESTFSSKVHEVLNLVIAGIFLVIIYQILKAVGLLNFALTSSTNYSSLVVIFLLGLTAGLSTCSGTISGIVLAIAANANQKSTSFITKFKPHLYFNLGRIVFFTLFGYLLGLIGSSFNLTLQHIGWVTIISSIVMILLGIQILGIFHFVGRINSIIPAYLAKSGFSKIQHKSLSNTFLIGGLTFFSPCGFTLGVQLFALTTANPIVGALSLGTFAIGTTPGLIGLSSLSFFVNKDKSNIVIKMIGLAVIFISINSFINGYNLLGYKKISFNSISFIPNSVLGVSDTQSTNPQNITVDGSVQLLRATYTNKDDMVPSNFAVKVGQKVRLEVDAKETGYGCMGSLALPAFTDKYEMFEEGKKVIFEFTPSQKGTYQITCAMGVPRGEITVI